MSSINCNNLVTLPTITTNVLQDDTKLVFDIQRRLNACACVNTKNYISVGSNPIIVDYNKYQIPDDAFNCEPDNCINTGTLSGTILAPVEGEVTGNLIVLFPIKYDATEYYSGILTFYLYASNPGTYTFSVLVGDISEVSSNESGSDGNFDRYNLTVKFDEAGYKPITIDLSSSPNSIIGNGWDVTSKGAVVRIQVLRTTSGITEDTTFGISTICVHDDISDFELGESAWLWCPTSITDGMTLTTIDTTCGAQTYDQSSYSEDITFEASRVSPNFHALNPLENKGEATEAYFLERAEKTIESVTINGVEYGKIDVPDLSTDICGFISATIPGCDRFASIFHRISIPTPTTLDDRDFQLLTSAAGVDDDGVSLENVLLFNAINIGEKVQIMYPRVYDGDFEHYVYNTSNINRRTVRVYRELCYDDGTKEITIWKNVLVTAMPGSYSKTDPTSWSITFTLRPDKEGNWYEKIILKRG